MRNRTSARLWAAALSLALLLTMLAASLPQALADDASAAGTTYYVDAQNGDDTAAGTTAATAWKTLEKVNATTFLPGDTILLRRGSSFLGTLWPKGSGQAGAPITLGAYGTDTDRLPLIDGDEIHYNHSASDYAFDSYVDAAVYLRNQSYWVIENLEVTNYARTKSDRAGIHIDATEGNYGNIVIRNCVVHDVANDGNAGEHARQGGINVWARAWKNAVSNVLIENNTVYNIGSTGIHVNGEKYKGDTTGIIVRGNYLYDIGGDGILVNACESPLIEYNVVNTAHRESTAACAGIWPFECTDALLQFNEAYNVQTTIDGQGFDADFMCEGTIFQYNYGHDNVGGFFLICCEKTNWDGSQAGFNRQPIIRYNIGQNNLNAQFLIASNITDALIYNNTIYIPEGSSSHIVYCYARAGVYPNHTQFYNNIIYNYGSGGYYMLDKATNTVFDSNLFYGYHASTEPEDANKLTDDPKLVGAGCAGVGFESCYNYKLRSDSPAIGTGRVIENNGGRDFFGNPVSATQRPNRGAYNGPGDDVSAPTPTTSTAYTGRTNRPQTCGVTVKTTLFDFEDGKTIGGSAGAVYSITNQSAVVNPETGSTKAQEIRVRPGEGRNGTPVEYYIGHDRFKGCDGVRMWLKSGTGHNEVMQFGFRFESWGSADYQGVPASLFATVVATPEGGWVYFDCAALGLPKVQLNASTKIVIQNVNIKIYEGSRENFVFYIDDIQGYTGDPYADPAFTTTAVTESSAAPTTATTAKPTQATQPTTAPQPDTRVWRTVYDWEGAAYRARPTMSAASAHWPEIASLGYQARLQAVDVAAAGQTPREGSSGALQYWSVYGYQNNAQLKLSLDDGCKNADAVRFWMLSSGSAYVQAYNICAAGSDAQGEAFKTVQADLKVTNGENGWKCYEITVPSGSTVTSLTVAVGFSPYSADVGMGSNYVLIDDIAVCGDGGAAGAYENPYYTADGMLSGLTPGLDATAFLQSFNPQGSAQAVLFDASGAPVSSGRVGTGMTVRLSNGNQSETFTVVLYGDVNGDGAFTAADILLLKRQILGLAPLGGACYTAANTNRDASGAVTAADLLLLKRQILSLAEIPQK